MSVEQDKAESVTQLRHGVRTPLNHIIGYAEMLLNDAPEAEAELNAAFLRSILHEAQRICELLQVNASPDGDVEGETKSLQRSMSEHVRQIRENAFKLSGSNPGDIERIRAATGTLVDFVESGSLPRALTQPIPRIPLPAIDLPSSYGRLLVVDDDELNRDVLQRHLERRGYQVAQASSGKDAISKLSCESFDAILLDLVMPDMNGLDVLDALKSLQQSIDVPVLVVSASDDLAGVADSIKKGAEDYLIKPYDPVFLDARLSATLERKRLRDRERSKTVELEHVTAALKRSNEDLQRFAYAASHDLQAPIRTITTYLQLLQRSVGSRLEQEEEEMLEFALGAAGRMHSLIRDLLLYSHASTDIRQPERVNAQELLSDLVEDLDALIKETRASITWDESLPELVTDATGMRQLFQNLISNSIKYRGDDFPKIFVSATREADGWIFCVEDNGQGIPPEYSKRIFEMFKRLHGEEIPGSGIGLATCQRIVERIGGKIWVTSEQNHGSKFYFSVPQQLRSDEHFLV